MNEKNGELQLDEIQSYLDARYLCPPEACASLFRFPTNRKSHTVVALPVHLEDEQSVVFHEDHPEQAVQNGPRHTELLAFFDLNNSNDPETRQLANSLLYHDIPQYFTFVKKIGTWKKRPRPIPDKVISTWAKTKPVIGRMHKVPVKDHELYAVLTLLLHVKGPQSYEHLRTVDVQTTRDDGTQITERKVCATLFKAALHRGLLD